MSRQTSRARPMLMLRIVLGFSSLLVPPIAATRSYDARSLWGYAAGLLVLLAASAGVWWLDRRQPSSGDAVSADQAIRFGLVLGLLWVVEISVNNFIAPPNPARDRIDNSFLAVIAVSIVVGSVRAAYRTGRLRDGVMAGTWSGFVSGALACCMALSLLVFWMDAVVHDPLNRAEWAARGAQSGAPTMAAYFAGETFAGALLHLTVLGVFMGALLGLLGGAVGKGIRAVHGREGQS